MTLKVNHVKNKETTWNICQVLKVSNVHRATRRIIQHQELLHIYVHRYCVCICNMTIQFNIWHIPLCHPGQGNNRLIA